MYTGRKQLFAAVQAAHPGQRAADESGGHRPGHAAPQAAAGRGEGGAAAGGAAGAHAGGRAAGGADADAGGHCVLRGQVWLPGGEDLEVSRVSEREGGGSLRCTHIDQWVSAPGGRGGVMLHRQFYTGVK